MSFIKNISQAKETFAKSMDAIAASVLTNVGNKFAVTELPSHFELRLALPGYAKEETNISFDEDTLVVTAQNKELGLVRETLLLGPEYDASEIQAKMVHGLLYIYIGRSIEVKKRTIPVQ